MNRNKNVLLVDDSEDDLFLIQAAFQPTRFRKPLREVHDGEEAIAYLAGEGAYQDRLQFPAPSVMILDLKMPRKNGFDVMTWVRSQPRLQPLTIVVLSASPRPDDIQRAFALGAASFLVKPDTLEELTAMIRSLEDWLQYNHFPPGNEIVKQ